MICFILLNVLIAAAFDHGNGLHHFQPPPHTSPAPSLLSQMGIGASRQTNATKKAAFFNDGFFVGLKVYLALYFICLRPIWHAVRFWLVRAAQSDKRPWEAAAHLS